jgi:hypothetical protein
MEEEAIKEEKKRQRKIIQRKFSGKWRTRRRNG